MVVMMDVLKVDQMVVMMDGLKVGGMGWMVWMG